MNNVITLPVGLSMLSIAISQANADTSNVHFVNKKMVINATRIEQTLDEATRSIHVLDKTQIDSIQPQSTAEIIAHEPNILIEGGSRPGYQTINIRGLGGNRVVQTIDGVRQDFESGHRASYFLDPVLLKNLQVIKGPASTLWGSGALGGAVAQSTIDAEDILKKHQPVGGLIKSGWNFNNDQSSTTSVLAGKGEQIDWLASVYYRDSNDIETGNDNPLLNSASRDNGLLAKINWDIDDQQTLSLNLRHAQTEAGVPSNGSSNVNGSSVFLINKDQVNSSASANYRYNPLSEMLNADVAVYWNDVSVDESRLSDGRFDATTKSTYGLNAKNVSKLGRSSLVYGIDGYHSRYDTQRGGTNRPSNQDTNNNVWGAFLQANIPLRDDLTLELGTRYDYFSTQAKHLNTERSDNALSPSAALIWQSTDQLDLILRHDQAFRAPTAEELYSAGTHFCFFPGFCNTFQSNPALEAERAANTELIIDYQATPELQLTSSVFYNKVDNFIEQTVTSPIFGGPGATAGTTYWSNVDKATLKGFEVQANYRLNQLNLKLGYGQTRGTDDNSGAPLSNIPADTWSASIDYAFLNNQLITGVKVVHAEEQYSASGATYDDYTVTDLYASWQPNALADLKVDLTISNLSDEYYRRAWSEIDEAGREVIISASYKF